MDGSGFDWLRSSSQTKNEDVSPAPQVSFGGISNTNNSKIDSLHSPQAEQQTEYGIHYSHENIPQQHLIHNGHYQSMLSIPTVGSQNMASDPILPMRHYSVSSPPIPNEEEHDSIPLSLKTQELTFEESKTYMRWYSDILARTNARTVTMNDVYTFLSNFKIQDDTKEQINRIFSKNLYSINIGEFFALLRLISHCLNGEKPSRKLIKSKIAPPTPPSILSKKRHTEEEDSEDDNENTSDFKNNSTSNNNQPLDLDSFTQFMLTGERPDEKKRLKKKSKKSKSVKFSDQIVSDIHETQPANISSPSPQEIDYSLPMDQLMAKIQNQQKAQPSQDAEEAEILKDMESQMNNFQNLNTVDKPGGHYDQFLRANNTGPSNMANMFSPPPESNDDSQVINNNANVNGSYSNDSMYLQPNMTGPAQMQMLRSNVTGPADMARLFSPNPEQQEGVPSISLQSFTNQMTGNTQENTIYNTRILSDGSRSSLHSPNNRQLPPPVPNRRNRSLSSPTPRVSSPLNNNAYGQASPVPLRSQPNSISKGVPPPPPPSRRRVTETSSNPPPLPPKVAQTQEIPSNEVYGNSEGNDSTANLLTDLKALQDEVDRIRHMTGGF